MGLRALNAYVQDGDVGCGALGSLSWHKCAVAELTIEEKIEYVREVYPVMSGEDKLEFTIYLLAEKLNVHN